MLAHGCSAGFVRRFWRPNHRLDANSIPLLIVFCEHIRMMKFIFLGFFFVDVIVIAFCLEC